MYISIETPQDSGTPFIRVAAMYTQPGGRIEISDSGAGRPAIQLYTSEYTLVATMYSPVEGKLLVKSFFE